MKQTRDLYLSVVVPAYRAADTLERCVAAIHASAQGAGHPFEIIVAENNSPDATLKVVRALEARFPEVRVVEEVQQGSYAARNRGASAARGSFLLFTDSDCLANSDFVPSLLGPLTDQGVRMVGGEIEGDPDQTDLVARYSRQAGILSQVHTYRHPHQPFFQTACMAVRNEDWELVDGFRSDLPTGGDADFCWRLQDAHPGELRLLERPLVRHLHRESVGALYRQFRRYGQSDVLLNRLHGAKVGGGKKLAEFLRIVAWPLLSVLHIPESILRMDLLPVASPFLAAVRCVGRWVGRRHALRHPGQLHRE